MAAFSVAAPTATQGTANLWFFSQRAAAVCVRRAKGSAVRGHVLAPGCLPRHGRAVGMQEQSHRSGPPPAVDLKSFF